MSYASSLRTLFAGVLALLLMGMATPAQAQMGDGELPKIDFSVNLMQSAQYLSFDADGTDPIAGFHAMRAGLTSSVQFSENVNGLLMLQSEPNDFAGIGAAGSLQPSVDFAILNLKLNDNLTFQTGTPVTGLLNFRGFSDGPVVQGNPMIGNSLADMITAGQGVKLIGSFDTFGFDLTVNRGFGEDLTTVQGGNTGVNVIAKARYTGSDLFKVGGGVGFSTGSGVGPNGPDASGQGLIFANGDRENYNLGSQGGGTTTHANMPSSTIAQVDGKVTAAGADVDLWAGYATESDTQIYGADNDFQALFGGVGLKYDLTDDFYAAGRFSYAGDQSDGASDADNTAMSRIQLGVGYMVYDKALLKVEYVTQSEAQNSALSRVDADWSGVTTELSFNF